MKYLYLLLVMFFMSGCITESIDGGSKVEAGDKLPVFNVVTSHGNTLTTNSLQGSASYILFFDTACPDCQAVLPEMQNFYSMLGNDACFIAIARDESPEEVSRYWKEHNYTIPFAATSDRSVYNLFAEQGVPRLYVSDKSLTVVAEFLEDEIPDAETLLRFSDGER